MNTKLWYLKHLDIFSGIPEKKLAVISSLMGSRNVGKRELVFQPEDLNKVYLLKSGSVELYHLNSEGKKVILDQLEPGSIFGDLAISESTENFAEATSDAFVCILTKDQFFEIVSKDPELSTRVMKFFLNKLSETERTISSLATDNLVFKFSSLLHRLAKNHGEENEIKIEIKEKFTHETLAAMLGVSRQTMTKLINALEKQKIITRSGKIISFDKVKFDDHYLS